MDDQTHIRIHMESEAILGVLAWCEAGKAELVDSVALAYESIITRTQQEKPLFKKPC
jgi:hypothetical protein